MNRYTSPLPTRPQILAFRPVNIVATYDYTDDSGALLYQKVRLDPKEFRQRRPDPAAKDGWNWKLGSCRRVLYQYPALRAAISDGQTVYVLEGEKAVDTLRAVGLIATCAGEGAATKWKADHNVVFAGADVVVLPDNDEAGSQHGLDVAHNLHGYAKSLKLVNLPDLPEKGDVHDWLAWRHPDELEDLVQATPLWIAEPKPEPKPVPGQLEQDNIPADKRRLEAIKTIILDHVARSNSIAVGRNNFRFKTGRSLGGIAGGLGFSDAEAVTWVMDLMPAVDEASARRAIKSGLTNGRKEPLVLRDRAYAGAR